MIQSLPHSFGTMLHIVIKSSVKVVSLSDILPSESIILFRAEIARLIETP